MHDSMTCGGKILAMVVWLEVFSNRSWNLIRTWVLSLLVDVKRWTEVI